MVEKNHGATMSKIEIIEELPRLSPADRLDVMRSLIGAEPDIVAVAMCDELAIERFRMLDGIEEEDGADAPR